MEAGVYKITCLPTGKIYIGSSKNIEHRWKTHKWSLNKGTHCNRHLANAWRKYGNDSFSFKAMVFCDSSSLIMYEQILIDSFSPDFNIAKTAGTTLGVKHRPETIQKLRNKQVGVTSPTKGKKRCPVAVLKTAEAHRGMKRSKETRKRISESMKGKKRKPYSAETIKKLSVANQGGRLSDSQVKAIRIERASGAKRKDLSNKFGVCPSMISLICSRERYSWVK